MGAAGVSGLWIMVAGPYRAGAADAEARAANLRVLNEAALAVFRRGHVPIIGVNLALPVIEAAGASSFDEIMMPLSLALAERCEWVGDDAARTFLQQRVESLWAAMPTE